MGTLVLLARAHAAGLTVEAVNGKLIIAGPRRAEPIVHELARHKAGVLLAPAGSSIANGTTAPVAINTARRCLTPTRDTPAKVTLGDTSYLLAIAIGPGGRGIWEFQREDYPDSGWTGCSPEFLTQIEDATRFSVLPESSISTTPVNSGAA